MRLEFDSFELLPGSSQAVYIIHASDGRYGIVTVLRERKGEEFGNSTITFWFDDLSQLHSYTSRLIGAVRRQSP